MNNKPKYLIPLTAFLIIAILLSGLYIMLVRSSATREREKYHSIAASQASLIHGCVDTILARAHTLRALVIAEKGGTDSFDLVASQIYDATVKDTGVALKNLAIAPEGIVEKVYPMSGNEALIGFSFLDPAKPGNAEAINAYQQGKMIITNPFELVQGGTGMAGRLPVFLTQGDKNEFWGLVTVTMDFDKLMETINLESLSDMGVDYKLWYKGDDGNPVILASSEDAPVKPVSYQFTIENLSWHLDVAPTKGWVDYVEIVIGFAVILSISLLLSLLLLSQERVRQSNKQLQRLANIDSLTSCYSRHYVNSVLLNQRTGGWNDPSVKFSLAIVDIDNFKSINDCFGHETGDRAILAVVRVLSDYINEADGDCIIRYGGDEFVLLFNNITREHFLSKLKSIVKDTRKVTFPDFPDLLLSVSIGGECYTSHEQSLYYDMIQRADEKLYQSKENGKIK